MPTFAILQHQIASSLTLMQYATGTFMARNLQPSKLPLSRIHIDVVFGALVICGERIWLSIKLKTNRDARV